MDPNNPSFGSDYAYEIPSDNFYRGPTYAFHIEFPPVQRIQQLRVYKDKQNIILVQNTDCPERADGVRYFDFTVHTTGTSTYDFLVLQEISTQENTWDQPGMSARPNLVFWFVTDIGTIVLANEGVVTQLPHLQHHHYDV
jgi:hypothetical protein